MWKRFLLLCLCGLTPLAQGCVEGIWISPARVRSLPVHGAAWDEVLEDAERDTSDPQLGVLNDKVDLYTYAKALLVVRLADEAGLVSFRGQDHVGSALSDLLEAEVLETLAAVVESEGEKCPFGTLLPDGRACSGEVLSLARNLPGYLIAADLLDVGEPLAGDLVAWLDPLRCTMLPVGAPPDDQHTLISTHEHRSNNWGTSAGFARALTILYLDRHARFQPSACPQADGQPDDLARSFEVFKSWLGVEIANHDEFNWNDNVSWQADETRPRAVNPVGSEKLCQANGELRNLDGALPEELRRLELPHPSGDFQDYCAAWPPPCENYVWSALQGAVPQAAVFARAGFLHAFELSDRAIGRALVWATTEQACPAVGDDTWIPYLANWYDSALQLPVVSPSRPGKAIGYTEWTHPCRPGSCGPVGPPGP